MLVIASLAWSFRLSDFPHNRTTLLLAIPLLLCVAGTVDTLRCMQRRWSFYHGGVVLCVYMDLMALAMIFFLLAYPYALWFAGGQSVRP